GFGMNILLVHNYYQTHHVGGEDKIFEDEKRALTEKLGEDKVYVYTVNNDQIRKWKIPFTIFFNFSHYRNIRQLIKQHNIKIVHIHNFFPLLTPSIFKAAYKEGAKVIQTLHNYRWWCLNGTFFDHNLKKNCERCAFKKWKFPGIQQKCYRKSWLQSLVAAMAF